MNKQNYSMILLLLFISVLFSCHVDINTKRMIEVLDSSENLLENESGIFEFPNMKPDISTTKSFTIRNIGSTYLALTEIPAVSISGT